MKYIRNNNLLALAIAVMMVVMSTTTAAALEAAASKKDKFVYNHHDHTIISENHGIRGNEGSVTNEEDSHYNFNDNTNREDRIKCNSHSIPANTGGEGNVPCLED